MKLVKQSCSVDSLDCISYDQHEYSCHDDSITGFYRKLYRKPNDQRNCTENSINEFLGPVANDESVTDAKLNIREKNLLDSPLSIQELDTAINQSDKKSAPGTDGISNKFIMKYWNLFRVPLFKYANACFDKGVLTALQKSA
jgi:hypothetical protein